MPDVDLDAVWRARSENAPLGPTITAAGREFRLKPRLTMLAAQHYFDAYQPGGGIDDAREFLRSVLNDPDDSDALLDAGFEWADMPLVLGAWKQEEGESSASSVSSGNGGTPSRPTSKRTTKSTSSKRSGRKR